MEDEPSSQESQIEEQKTEDNSQSPQLDIDRLKHHVRQQGRLLDALSRKVCIFCFSDFPFSI